MLIVRRVSRLRVLSEAVREGGMDEILDPFVAGGQVQKVPLGTISPASSPAFVVGERGSHE
jgi:hypothetical protein